MQVLYISYDGLTDHIGQSQVLPYLIGCAEAGHNITVISFEKPDRQALLGEAVKRQCERAGIRWMPHRFRSRPPYLAKLIDQWVMRRSALASAKKEHFELVHCRSYQAALVGLDVKRQTGARFVFDMRGFLPDSRREGGRWTKASFLGELLYRRWKGHEASLIAGSDHLVALTLAARDEMKRWPAYRGAPISVIPCCADFSLFEPAEKVHRDQARQQLGIEPDAPVLGYLGSRGTIYMIADHLRLFDAIRRRQPKAKALFVGNPDPRDIYAAATKVGIELTGTDFRLVHAERGEVPLWLSTMDAGTSFYTPTYSSLHVSPTKMAEYLACGTPVIANRAVGDVDLLISRLAAGHILADFSNEQVELAAEAFVELQSFDRAQLRDRAKSILDLPIAVASYLRLYADPSKPVSAVQ